MRLAALQAPVGDLTYAFDTLTWALQAAGAAGAQMLTAPEVWLPGYNSDHIADLAQARDGAWALAERLVAAPKDQWAAIIAEQDDTVAALGRKIYPLKGVAGLAARWIRDRESTDIRFNVQVMAS